jgi:hypothetical protein
MHGFVNLVLADALARDGARVATDTIAAVLEESDPRSFAIEPGAIRWRELTFTAGALAAARAHGLRSVGSCSFDEPVEDLRALGWWPE